MKTRKSLESKVPRSPGTSGRFFPGQKQNTVGMLSLVVDSEGRTCSEINNGEVKQGGGAFNPRIWEAEVGGSL